MEIQISSNSLFCLVQPLRSFSSTRDYFFYVLHALPLHRKACAVRDRWKVILGLKITVGILQKSYCLHQEVCRASLFFVESCFYSNVKISPPPIFWDLVIDANTWKYNQIMNLNSISSVSVTCIHSPAFLLAPFLLSKFVSKEACTMSVRTAD